MLSNGILPSNTLAAGKSLLHNIADLILHSKTFFKRVSLQTAADAQTLSDYTFLPLVTALGILSTFLIKGNWFKQSDIQILYGWEPDPNPPPGPNDPNPDKIPNTPNADQISSRMLSVSFANSQPNTPDEMPWSLLTTIAFVPKDEGGEGLFVSLGGSLSFAHLFEGKTWKLTVTFSSAGAFDFTSLFEGDLIHLPPDAGVQLTLEHLPDPTALPQKFDVGGAKIEFGDFKISAGVGSSGFQLRAVAREKRLRCGHQERPCDGSRGG